MREPEESGKYSIDRTQTSVRCGVAPGVRMREVMASDGERWSVMASEERRKTS